MILRPVITSAKSKTEFSVTLFLSSDAYFDYHKCFHLIVFLPPYSLYHLHFLEYRYQLDSDEKNY